MRLPGFTAERVVPSYSGGPSAVGNGARKRLATSRPVGIGYGCTPDGRACSCSGDFDCWMCLNDPNACGGKTICLCDPYGCGCV